MAGSVLHRTVTGTDEGLRGLGSAAVLGSSSLLFSFPFWPISLPILTSWPGLSLRGFGRGTQLVPPHLATQTTPSSATEARSGRGPHSDATRGALRHPGPNGIRPEDHLPHVNQPIKRLAIADRMNQPPPVCLHNRRCGVLTPPTPLICPIPVPPQSTPTTFGHHAGI